MSAGPRFPERLATGRLLDTAATLRWTAAERDAKDRMERRELYAGFRPEDEGRSRVRVATCGGPLPEEIAAEIVRRWNAHADLLAACAHLLTPHVGGRIDPEKCFECRACVDVVAKAKGGA